MKFKTITLLFLSILVNLLAQKETDNALPIISDSLRQVMQKEIEQTYGFSEYSTLAQAAELIKVDLAALKGQLGFEPQNMKINKVTLKQLNISPYHVLLAKENIEYGFNELSSLREISNKFSIPTNILKRLLGLDPLDRKINSYSLQALSLSIEDVQKAISEFQNSKYFFGSNVTLVGMLVVFFALLLTSLVLMQLRHLNQDQSTKGKTLKMVIDKKGNLKSTHINTDQDLIAAVIAAYHLHKYTIEERRRLHLTFKRTSMNYWHASNIINMPNREFDHRR